MTRTGIRRCVGNDFALLRCHQRPAAGQRNATAVALRRFCGATQQTTQRRPGGLGWTTRTANLSCVASEPPSLTPPGARPVSCDFFKNVIELASTRHTPTSRTPARATCQQAELCRQTASPPMLLRPSRLPSSSRFNFPSLRRTRRNIRVVTVVDTMTPNLRDSATSL